MTEKIYSHIDTIFDKLYKRFESVKSFRIISTLLVLIFILSILAVFINNNFNLPENISSNLSNSYFFAVESVFSLLLAIEIIEMVFVLAHSVTESIAKQFEIFSLILLRQAFKEFSTIDLPIDIHAVITPITYILSDIFGALIIFGGILIFVKMQKHMKISSSDIDNKHFTIAKKGLALFMFVAFVGIGFYDIFLYLTHNHPFTFFTMFYGILVFTDILIVIISLRYSHLYCVVFRNTGFAIATILIRFALSLPRYFDAMAGILAVVFVIGVSFVYNKYIFKKTKYEDIIK
jgi:hypothetical protein